LSKILSPTQIDLILNPKEKAFRWPNEDISTAISLRSASSKAYSYMREKKIIPC